MQTLPNRELVPGRRGAGDSELVRVNLNGTKVTTAQSAPEHGAGSGSANTSASRTSTRTVLTNLPGVVPTNPTYGTLSRNSFRGPSRQNIDMTVAKVTPLFKGDHPLTLEIRGDFFNLLNTPEFANPITTFTAANFGEITTTYTDSYRIIQLAGKLRF